MIFPCSPFFKTPLLYFPGVYFKWAFGGGGWGWGWILKLDFKAVCVRLLLFRQHKYGPNSQITDQVHARGVVFFFFSQYFVVGGLGIMHKRI